jgi:hypothetical protein
MADFVAAGCRQGHVPLAGRNLLGTGGKFEDRPGEAPGEAAGQQVADGAAEQQQPEEAQ